jgi:hypothetical protein
VLAQRKASPMSLQYQMQIKQALHVEENCTGPWVRWILKILRMIRPYIVCNTWNLVGPGRFVIDGFNNRISVVDEVVE